MGFSVQDGRAGFPVRYLEESSGGVALRIVDGELQLRSPGAMRGYLDQPGAAVEEGWLSTGDLVRIEGDRVYFLGAAERADQRRRQQGLAGRGGAGS